MNHNGTVDRFENDEEMIFPIAATVEDTMCMEGFFIADVRLTVGRQHLREIADDGRSKALCNLTADHAFSWARYACL